LIAGCAGGVSSNGSGNGSGGGASTPPSTPAAVSVTLSLPSVSIQVGATQAFTATVANDASNKGVSWTLTGAGCSGSTCGPVTPAVTASGVAVMYTAPTAVPSPATVTLTATSVADLTKFASSTITLTTTPPPVAVTLSLPSAIVTANGTQAFT